MKPCRIDDAALASATNGNVFYLAEIHRLRGEIMLARNQEEAAESCFQQSLEISRSQQAKSWELRTAMSLCRLWQSQNRRQEVQCSRLVLTLGSRKDSKLPTWSTRNNCWIHFSKGRISWAIY